MKKTIALAMVMAAALGMRAGVCAAQGTAAHTFAVENGKFALDGKPFQIISGEMHSPRIPRAYWRQRLQMAKAMGLNTVTAYVFWNEHETAPGVFDFSGQHDVAEFIREAQQEGLYVILRPGPYVCAEWEWGGYPAWLLKDHGIVVRSADPKFMEPAKRWLMRLGKELAPLQIGNGGPIIAVQVENEYGSFGNDHAYMEQIKQTILDAGFTNALLYTADGPEELKDGTLPELPAVINFGPGDAKHGFEILHQFRPQGPFMNGEYWAGWFDHWGEKHHTTDAQKQADEVNWILSQGYSISIYMFHGGTSFGWMNGANIGRGGVYEPDVTSYDYDSPLDESGRPGAKYPLFRAAIVKATGVTPPAVPKVDAAVAVPPAAMSESVPLWSELGKPVHSEQVLTMEDLDQAYGYILYRKTIAEAVKGALELDDLHDYAMVYADGKLLGTQDRRLSQNTMDVTLKAGTRLDILVENTGRVNFTTVIRGERKGITKQVLLAGKPVTGWDIYSLPMKRPETMAFKDADCSGACFYRGTLTVDKVGDTFLDTSSFTKGFVWVNGHELGRVWSIGPQKTLYLPGPWLKQGPNEVIVFDLEGGPGKVVEGKAVPELDGAVTTAQQ